MTGSGIFEIPMNIPPGIGEASPSPCSVTCICDGFHNKVTLTFDLLTSESMHEQVVPYRPICTKFGVERRKLKLFFFYSADTHV